jgi:hypothetical protein
MLAQTSLTDFTLRVNLVDVGMAPTKETKMTRLQHSDRPIPVNLPSTIQELEKYRTFGPELTLNDHVEVAFKKLWEEQGFRALINATGDDETVEGSMATDNVMAAQMIRNHATNNGQTEITDRKLHAIVRALKVVMNRYNMSRKLRARTLGGEVIPSDEGNGE